MNEEFESFNLATTDNVEQFLEWRSPRLGTENPTKFESPLWSWIVRGKYCAWKVNEKFYGRNPFDEGPTWCFDRYGQTSIPLPDGRVIYIGGEHEDFYDPDFYIYNDVVVTHPDGHIEFYCYPKNIFPSTDFHTATLVGETIIIIGSLGYQDSRKIGETQVYGLNIQNFEINKITTSGSAPGWIHRHKAELSSDGTYILISKGLLETINDPKSSLIENIDEWKLNLTDYRWIRLTDRKWERWEVKRGDCKRNHLWDIERVLWYSEVNWTEEFEQSINKLTDELGKTPNLDIMRGFYSPPTTYRLLPEVDFGELEESEIEWNDYENGTCRILVQGVIVRYVNTHYSIQATVEGTLPTNIIEILKSDLLNKLSILENTECLIENISS